MSTIDETFVKGIEESLTSHTATNLAYVLVDDPFVLTEDQLEEVVEVAMSYYSVDEPVDWISLFERVEDERNIDLPEDLLHPTILRIRKAVRKARKEARA